MKALPEFGRDTLPACAKILSWKSRHGQGVVLILLILLFVFSLKSLDHVKQASHNFLDQYTGPLSKITGTNRGRMAKRLYPKELLQRPLPTDLTSIPRLFHQSWINETMPTKFEEWSNSCRKAHPDWEWVLWTDEDNLKLVEKYAPWFNTTYELLRSEIFRADAARNIYMHVFGG